MLNASAWWRAGGLPTPEEWSALWAFCTFAAAVAAGLVTLYQLRLSRVANQSSASATRAMSEATEAETRPYLVVKLRLWATPAGNPREESGQGVAFVVVENVGRTAARAINLTSDPQFKSSGDGKPDEKPDLPLEALQKTFDGQNTIGMLAPGERLEFLLDTTSKLMSADDELASDGSALPRKYSIAASYFGPSNEHPYRDSFELDAVIFQMGVKRAANEDVVARQMRRLNENIERFMLER